jgi:hypothetical protein
VPQWRNCSIEISRDYLLLFAHYKYSFFVRRLRGLWKCYWRLPEKIRCSFERHDGKFWSFVCNIAYLITCRRLLNIQLVSGEFFVQLICLRRSGVWRVGRAHYCRRRTSRLSAFSSLVSLIQRRPSVPAITACRNVTIFVLFMHVGPIDDFRNVPMILRPHRAPAINFILTSYRTSTIASNSTFREVLRRIWSAGWLIECKFLDCSFSLTLNLIIVCSRLNFDFHI